MNLMSPHLVVKATNRTADTLLGETHRMKELFPGGIVGPAANYGLSAEDFLLNHPRPEKPRSLTETLNGSRHGPLISRRFKMGFAVDVGWPEPA